MTFLQMVLKRLCLSDADLDEVVRVLPNTNFMLITRRKTTRTIRKIIDNESTNFIYVLRREMWLNLLLPD